MIKKINKYKRLMSFQLRQKIEKKIVIIESDDWGMERAKDQECLDAIIDKYKKKRISRWTTDALETVDDMKLLYDLLDSHKDKFRFKPIITANFITHNIDHSSPEQLVFKPISDGYNFADNKIFKSYTDGIARGFFKPQLHGYSHYDTNLLAEDFNSKRFQKNLKLGFATAKTTIKKHLSLYRAECFDPNFENNIHQAAEVFKNVFGYYSDSFIPPNYSYLDSLNPILYKNNIKSLQAASHFVDRNGNNSVNAQYKYKNNLLYTARNARLDTHPDYDYLADNCINQIETAFSQKVPAVIDIHRVNFSGKFSPNTRQKTIEELDKVLRYLYKFYPDVVFMTSDELLRIYQK
jgi:hypothetical protein